MSGKRVLNVIPLIFWLFIVTIKLIGILPMYDGERLINSLTTLSIVTPLEIVSFAFFYYLIIPSLVLKKRLDINISLSLLFILLYGFVWVWVYHITGRIATNDGFQIIYVASYGHTILSTLYAFVLRLSVDWFNKYRRQKELEKQNSLTELALLRSQINPHFLFNTLNNIHAFSTRDPEKTSFAIIKLSEIMRYMLYEASHEKVLLDQELDYIRNFIALQKLRFQEMDFVRFTVKGNTTGIQIPPMIFLPFIENAFKHGTVGVTHAIEIDLNCSQNQLYFGCKNQMKPPSETEQNQPGGLGIKNIRRRLEILFPKQHQLDIREEKNVYIVELNINLHGN